MQPYGNNDDDPPDLAPPPLDLGAFISHNPSNTPSSSFGNSFSTAPGTMSGDALRQISHRGPGGSDNGMYTSLTGQGSGTGGFEKDLGQPGKCKFLLLLSDIDRLCA